MKERPQRHWFRWWPRRASAEPPRSREDPLEATERAMTEALASVLRARDPLLDIVAHCARVASLANWLAAELDVPPGDREVLDRAARLHEVGMVAVPPKLLERPAPLTSEELERVRAQAWIGANIVGATHGPRAARLIEHQYRDHLVLRERFVDDVDLLLAGILRVADVFDAMCHPRPYQHHLSDDYRVEVLRSGMGTKFHPRVTRLMLR